VPAQGSARRCRARRSELVLRGVEVAYPVRLNTGIA
jgi:hypothetical protein